MSRRISDRVDINEQRKHLNKLDQEIERAMQGTSNPPIFIPLELENLNQQTKLQNRALKMKLHNPNTSISPKSVQSTQSFLTNNSTYMLFKDASKLVSPQIELHLSPENLIPQGDLFKELGFGSENKENAFNQLSVTNCVLALKLMNRSLLQMNLE